MSFSESCRVLFKHKDYDVLIAVKIFLPSLHSLAGNRNVTKDDTAAPFAVRMAHQWQGCFPWEPSSSLAETGGAAGVGTGGQPCGVRSAVLGLAALCVPSADSLLPPVHLVPLLTSSRHSHPKGFWPGSKYAWYWITALAVAEYKRLRRRLFCVFLRNKTNE